MARKYGKRPRMTCRGCGKDVAQSTTTGSERTHKCPHGRPCYGSPASLACGDCDRERKAKAPAK